jgi:hypothetical protein
MELLLAVAILALVAAFVIAPLRREHSAQEDPVQAKRAELEARKEVLYREIRDAEADHATGKLAEQEYKRLDRDLRGQAIDVLKRLDALESERTP